MTTTKQSEASEGSLTRLLLYTARYYLGDRRVLWALAAIALVGGLALNWGWLVAAGLAPILLATLPCVAMCALGLCANKMAGRSKPSDATASRTNLEAAGDRKASLDVAESRGGANDPLRQLSACCDDRPEAPATTREKENIRA